MSGIFISYRHNGGFPTANHLADKLRERGYNVCFDKTSLKQGKFDEKILVQIEECTDFIVVLDKDAFVRTLKEEPLEKDWLRRELAHAIKHKKNIVPVMLSGFEWPEHLPSDIKEVSIYNGPEYSRTYFNAFCDNLTTFLKTQVPKPTLTKGQQTLSFLKKYKKYVFWSLFLIGLLFGGYLYYGLPLEKQKQEITRLNHDLDSLDSIKTKLEEPVLLLVGGGSVHGFIHDCIDSTVLDKYVYVPLASSAAWPLIKEERSIGSIDNKHPYYMVLLSAKKAVDTSFIEKKNMDDFKKKIGYVIEIKIGESNLQAAFSRDNNINCFSKQDTISTIELSQYLLNNRGKINIFTTNVNTSATWIAYDNLLNNYLSNKKIKTAGVFERNDTPEDFRKVSNKPYVILESRSYKAKNLTEGENGDVHRFVIYDNENQKLVSCPMYLYFVAYRKSEFYYVIPRIVRWFLSDMDGIILPQDGSNDLLPRFQNLIRVFDKDQQKFQ